MAVYFIQAFIIWISGIGRYVNSSEKKRKHYMIMSFLLLTALAGARKYTVGSDLAAHYASSFINISNLSWSAIPEFNAKMGYTIGYSYYCKLVATICPDLQFFIFITSAITLGVLCWFIYKNSDDVVLSTNLFVLYCINYMYMNIIRQGMAISALLIGCEFLKRTELKWRRYALFTLFVLIATAFHTSAALCMVIIVFDAVPFKKTNIIAVFIGTMSVFLFYHELYNAVLKLYGAASGNYSRYLTSATEGIGNFNLQSLADVCLCLSAVVLAYCLLIVPGQTKCKISGVQEEKSPYGYRDGFLLYMGILAFICRLLVFRMNIIYRYSYYFIPFFLILYPRAIKRLSGRNRMNLRAIIYTVFAVYFVLMTFKYAEMFYGTVPYQFFWQ